MSSEKVFVIGVCGGSGSGKSTMCSSLIDMLPSSTRSRILSMDCFYHPLNEEKLRKALQSKYDFDHPSALDIDRFKEVVTRISNREQVSIPDYDFVTHSLTKENIHHYNGKDLDVLFVEGIHVFQCPELFDLKVFVDVDADERLARRILRDTQDRGRTHEGSITEWRNFVKPNYDGIISQTRIHADIIVPRGGGNQIAFKMISSYINEHFI